MAKIGRNDPCPCGSGKKYKQCHEPIDRAAADHARLLRRAQDRLMSKLIEATQSESMMPYLSTGLSDYWDNRYSVTDVNELDEHEDNGSERFLTWFAFDARDDNNTTLVERITADPPAELELDEYERELLSTWQTTRLRPYLVAHVIKGKGALIRDVLTEQEYTLRDHAAAKRLEQDELIFAHLVPAGDEMFIAGLAAQTTPDTREKLDEFLAVSLEDWKLKNPDSDMEQFIKQNSHLFNHFVMSLPREEHEPSRFDDLMLRGRTALAMTKEALGVSASDEDDDDEDDDDDLEPIDDLDLVDDEDDPGETIDEVK